MAVCFFAETKGCTACSQVAIKEIGPLRSLVLVLVYSDIVKFYRH